jgi:predicted amidohydrolase
VRGTLRVAAFQRRPLFNDVPGTLERICTDLKWCERARVQLALFPECFLQGYATDRETIACRALALSEASFERMLIRLAHFPTELIIGMIERRSAAYFNSAAVIRRGRVLGAYAKTHPNEPGFQAGTEYPTFEASGWQFGVNICNDANYPEAAHRLSEQGATLICYPLNNMLSPGTALKWRFRSVENLRQRARETGCWVVSADIVGQCGSRMSYGCTCIVRPDGTMAARVSEGNEGTALFDLP